MAEIARKTKRYPSDLTDEEWERIKPFLPKPPKRGRKLMVNLREILNAIRYVARSAGGWRMLPHETFLKKRWRGCVIAMNSMSSAMWLCRSTCICCWVNRARICSQLVCRH